MSHIVKPNFGELAWAPNDVAYRYRSLWDGLRGAYLFAIGGGGTVYNIADRGTLDGTISGATWETGEHGNQLDFVAASNHHVDLNGNFGFGAVGNPFTVTLLFNPGTVTGDHQILARYDGTDDLYQFGHSVNQLRAAYGPVAALATPASAVGTIVIGQSHLGCLAIDNVNAGILYLDGIEAATATAVGDFSDPTELHIGNRGGDDAENFDGKTTLVQVHERTLEPNEVSEQHVDPFASYRKTRQVFGFVAPVGGVTVPALDEGMLVGGLMPLRGGLG